MQQLNGFTWEEGLDYWFYGLSEVGSHYIGVKYVHVVIGTDADGKYGKQPYGVIEEIVKELTSWHEPLDMIIRTLVTEAIFESGDLNVVKTFTTLEEATNYANKHYPPLNMKSTIKARFNEREAYQPSQLITG